MGHVTLETALQTTQILLALACLQQSAEHLTLDPRHRPLFLLRAGLCLVLLTDLPALWPLIGLAVINLVMLHRFQGPYNGGSDRMTVLVLWGLLAAHLVPDGSWQEVCLGYIALQLTLSYFMSGRVKLLNPDWRNGQALSDVFAFSAYPVSTSLRRLSDRKPLMVAASWLVIGFEVAFPLALLHPTLLTLALGIAALFHLANACLFGLNRFLWIWLSAYPSVMWLQDRAFGV